MFIFKDSKKRVNIYSTYVDEKGTMYPFVPSELVEEIGEPLPPEDFSYETHYRKEIDEAPYVIYERKPVEVFQKEEQKRINLTARRFLNETDWLVTRFVETNVPIPEEIRLKRQEARDSIK